MSTFSSVTEVWEPSQAQDYTTAASTLTRGVRSCVESPLLLTDVGPARQGEVAWRAPADPSKVTFLRFLTWPRLELLMLVCLSCRFATAASKGFVRPKVTYIFHSVYFAAMAA